MGFGLLTRVILGAHFCYLAYVIFGGFLAWRWPRTIWLHLAAVGWGVALVVGSLPCPLTWAENWSRRRDGLPPLTNGFVDRYIEGVLYPERYTNLVRVLVGLVVLGSWVGFAVIRRRSREREGARAAAQRTAA